MMSKKNLRDPRSCMGISVLLGALLFGIGGMVAGYTGLCLSENRAGPWGHALFIGGRASFYGFIAGFIVGYVANRLRPRK
jgi:hypothetical protein